MCRMTATGLRWKSAIGGSGFWIVLMYEGSERYIRLDRIYYGKNLKYLWLGKPLYAINVKARDWGVRA